MDQIFKMTERRFQVARRLIKNKPWDFFMMVRDGPRPAAPLLLAVLRPAPPAVRGRQQVRDGVPRLLPVPRQARSARCSRCCPRTSITIAMSDHGARPMMGGLCFNDWLIQEGYLALKEPVARDHADREGRRSTGAARSRGATAATTGGCFLNVKGREPSGIVEPARYEALRDEMIAKLEALPGPDGRPMGTKVHQAAGRLPRGPRRRARPDRVLRRPRLALGRRPSATRASTRSRTTPAPTAPTTTARRSSPWSNLPGQPTRQRGGHEPGRRRARRSCRCTTSRRRPGAVGRSFL